VGAIIVKKVAVLSRVQPQTHVPKTLKITESGTCLASTGTWQGASHNPPDEKELPVSNLVFSSSGRRRLNCTSNTRLRNAGPSPTRPATERLPAIASG